MSSVVCKVNRCPYCDDKYGLCRNPLLAIDENGMCGVLWNKGQPRQVNINDDSFGDRIDINVLEG